MHRDEALLVVLRAVRLAGAALFVGNGFGARAAAAIDDRPLNFYMLGSMSLAPTLAAGFSHWAGRPVVVVEGDGNALMGLSGLPVVVAAGRGPFVHVVLDNRVYESTGGQRTLSPHVDLCAVARAAGYGSVQSVAGCASLTRAVGEALAHPGPSYLRVHTGRAPAGHGRVPHHPREITRRFRAALAEAAPSKASSRGEGAIHT